MPKKSKKAVRRLAVRSLNPAEVCDRQWEEVATIAALMTESGHLGGNEAKCLIAAFLEWVENGMKCLGIDGVDEDHQSIAEDFSLN